MVDRLAQLKTALKSRILVLDGAMGTCLQDLRLQPADFGGESLDGCNEILVRTRPDVIRRIHADYLEAGADILETNSFGGTPLVLAEYGLEDHARDLNFEAARLAREVADQYSTPERPRFVAGSMGPTTKAMTVTGGVTFEDLANHFKVQAEGLMEGGTDFLLLETCQDTRNIKAGLLGISRAETALGRPIPVAVSVTIEPMGTMLAGQSIEALLTSLKHLDLLYLGLNCATGPEFMTDHIRSLARLCPFPVACVPNAGLPDEEGRYLETPETVAAVLSRFLDKGWLNVVGGCCGTRPGHIRALAKMVAGKAPRVAQPPKLTAVSGVDYLDITDDIRPVIVGERTNVIGSKKFRDLICEGKFDEATEIARAQIKKGAHILDVCLANPDRDEMSDMRQFLELAIKKVRVPLMIDSTDADVIADALTYSQGKAIINSINLEDGEERFEKVVPLARAFGAALVVGTIDDDPVQGMGISRERKLQIARRSFDLLTKKYGVAAEDIIWDPLTFPCATGDQNYIGSARETIEAIRLLKSEFPGTKTILGVSNVSFGLPPAGREVLNSVFLYHCVQAGLDLAIVNSEKLVRFTQISPEERALSDALLFNEGQDPVAAFAAHFRQAKAKAQADRASIPLDKRLSMAVLEGSKDGLTEDLAEALKTSTPLDIINGPLMRGMDEVGKLFNENKLIVAEVLQSAEVMKAAVSFLEPHMDRDANASRGKILLATVKGDVHDIGKNLVDIILSNNGFQVVNLGIRIPPEQLIAAVREHAPDIIGLSGLLVKSAQQMVTTAEDLARAGIRTPMLVGGAALSERFVDTKIAVAYGEGTVAYASDAMNGLELAKTIVDAERFDRFRVELAGRRAKSASTTPLPTGPAPTAAPAVRSSLVPVLSELPEPPDFERHSLRNTPIQQIFRFINPLMLYGRHLGVRGSVAKLMGELDLDPASAPRLKAQIEEKDPNALKIWDAVQNLKAEFSDTAVLRPAGVFQFFRATGIGNRVELANGSALEFPRQRRPDGLCLADYVGENDSLALFAVTVGRGLREMAEGLKARGEFLKSHALQALALESAEAYAEWMHSQIRKQWGFPDSPDLTMLERFQARYRGKRYSFGYPACPRLDDQAMLFALLRPEEIGLHLTEGYMMDPEASVSALVFHHPAAVYFSVGTTATGADTVEAQR